MYEHDDLVDENYPSPGSNQTQVAMNVPKAANDNKNLDLGTGGIDMDKAWGNLIKTMSKPTLRVIKGDKR